MKFNYIPLKKFLPFIGLAYLFSGCTKFLDEPISKTTSLEIKTTDQLNALLNNYDFFYTEANRSQVFSTDDFGLTPQLYDAQRSVFNQLSMIQFATWDTEFIVNDTKETFWSKEYNKIFQANLVLENLKRVSGSEEEKAKLKAEAHFIRAYSYWELVNTYCLPYSVSNQNEMGLPIKLKTNFEEPLERQPLETVYQLIESDLAEALKTSVELKDARRHWRASKEAVNAFAARFYLTKNEYAKALSYANTVLISYNSLVDYNDEMDYGKSTTITINANKPNQKKVSIQYPYTAINSTDKTDMLNWKEFLYFRMLSNSFSWYIPSQELLDLYDQDHDLRYEYHIVEGYSYIKGMISPAYDYPGYTFFAKDLVPNGPTVAEVILIKAEAQARLNNPTVAMSTLNTLRKMRLTPGPWVNLSATDKDSAIKQILEERRREMPFAQRWFDIRRYNNNDYSLDDVVVTTAFYPYNESTVLYNQAVKTYTLQKNSRRYAAPIPNADIITSNGKIKQNIY
ncbi:RagB/SusD family nutrient uptake outer membrane protein [Pedobacter sp. MW01-1-1]|uniref:RagB/SusD family nutrient uptake outer membrane protein n=1 Tax=Pedobacter sp. MW01-1-1 TaxID=3383027 RepID=UPI003FEFB224